MTTWIDRTPAGVRIVRDTGNMMLVDDPARGRYRELSDVDTSGMVRLVEVPADLARLAGWYEGGLLLTHVPEPYFGEPMVLLGDGDRVVRAYPVAADRYLTGDGRDMVTAPDLLTVDGVAHPRSTAVAERGVEFAAGDAVLRGTVIVPTTPDRHPAAVLLHGAAGGQRDFCRFQAGPILAAGVAVLVYDKAGHGLSTGSEPSIFDQAEAAEAGLRVLRAQPDVDPARTGIAGFSNGMWAAPIAAARQHPAFVAGVGAPGVSMAESEVHRRTKLLRDAGVGPATVAAAGAAWRAIFGIVADGPDEDRLRALAEALETLRASTDLGRYEVPDFVRRNPMVSPVPPLTALPDLLEMLGSARDPQLGYDPAADYARLTCPVFLQYGADDTSVPVRASVARIGGAATVRVYPHVEHMLNLPPRAHSGISAEEVMYQFHDFTFAPGAWADLTRWLKANV
jgi:hypothetical protein